ncbi:MAG: SIMPL domain-containing protein [Acidobacteriota bacterium]
MKHTTIALAAALALAVPLSAQTSAGEPVVPVLSVQGSGSSRVNPDEATVRLGVLAQAPTARAVMQQVNQTANAILAAVRTLGIPDKEVQTSELNLGPVYAQSSPEAGGEPRIVGYQASNVVSVRLTRMEQVGQVVDVGLAAGANRLDGVVFGLQNDETARSAALAKAAAGARSKAAALAKALNVRLAEIVEVVEGGVTVYTPMRRMAMESMAAMSADAPVSDGQVGVDANLTLRYRIEPCPAQGCP